MSTHLYRRTLEEIAARGPHAPGATLGALAAAALRYRRGPTPVGWTAALAEVHVRDRISCQPPAVHVLFSREDVAWTLDPEARVEVGRTADGRVMGVRVLGVDRG